MSISVGSARTVALFRLPFIAPRIRLHPRPTLTIPCVSYVCSSLGKEEKLPLSRI